MWYSLVCNATGLKQYTVCRDVIKSQCTKSKCKVKARGGPELKDNFSSSLAIL